MSATLPPLPPASRELLETLWTRNGPVNTRSLHDAATARYPHRAGRRINTTSSLLAALAQQGWIRGWKAGGTRWRWSPAVGRTEGLRHLARLAVAEFTDDCRDA